MTHEQASKEQRRHARFEILEYALVYPASEAGPIQAVVVDISLGGLQTRSRSSFLPGEQCLLVIGQGGEPPIRLNAEVRRCSLVENTSLYATGFLFKPETPEERTSLVNYIHEAFQRRGEILLGC